MGANPEQAARREIDRLLAASGWAVQDVAAADLHAARGVALREFPLNPGHGTAEGAGHEFAQKITYRTTGSKPEELIKALRASYYPRIAGTDPRTT